MKIVVCVSSCGVSLRLPTNKILFVSLFECARVPGLGVDRERL